ncbi:MAG: endonuclease III [Pirellulales bacterium]|nr:endonuclease III [Pirellulales bacterium]
MTRAVDAQRHASRVAELLRKAYPEAQCALVHRSPLELLVATILSAQCTDQRVNLVTPALFKKYRSAAAFAASPPGVLEKEIQSTGFFNAKAKSIRACCRQLAEDHGGQVPRELDTLVKLPGVGRKTANVVLGTAYGIASGVVVDTHVARLSYRLGLTKHKDPVKIEQDLMALLPATEWVDFSHRLIHHGRQICIARKPKCEVCPLLAECPQHGVVLTAGGNKPGRAKGSQAATRSKAAATKPRSAAAKGALAAARNGAPKKSAQSSAAKAKVKPKPQTRSARP